jgi:hypothetical protein
MKLPVKTPRSGTMMQFTVSLLLCAFGSFWVLAQDLPKPEISKAPLTDEQLAVYRTVVSDYMKNSRATLNLSNRTYPLELDPGCVHGFSPEQLGNSGPMVHAFSAAPAPKVSLVDPEQQKSKISENDPQNLMKKAIDEREPVTDEQLNKSLELAFSTGIFSFSEIIFDKGHRSAMVSYSFVCGSLCGHGNTLVLERTVNRWKVRKTCSSWIS